MFPLINKRETGINLRRIMDIRGVTAKDVQYYLNLGCVQSVYRWLDGINMPKSLSQIRKEYMEIWSSRNLQNFNFTVNEGVN